MGSKYEHHILDPFLNDKIVANFDEIAKYKNLGDQVYSNDDLAKFGQSEQQKIFDGNYGSTMIANAARNSGARDIKALKENGTIGAGAIARSGRNPASAGATFMYDRLMQDQVNRVNDRTAAITSESLPGYVNQSAEWADAGNKALQQKLGFGQAYQGMLSNAIQQRMSNQTFEKKKSLWDKIKEGVGFAGNLVGIASGIGAPFSMNSGGGQVQTAGTGNMVGTAGRSGGYSQYY